MMIKPSIVAAVCWTLVSFTTFVAAAAPKDLEFSRDILPLLSDKCFVCHGPDASDDTELQLDSFENATQDLGGYSAINPENLNASEIIQRVFSDDDPMPPLDAEKQLTPEEKATIKEWVLSGGEYKQHWAFIRPERSTSANSIDGFISKGLKSEGIGFAAEADKATLARRAALVLTGLPPEPEQLKRYMANDDANAYGQLVDELLQSTRFGEHNARYWLDAVRYGDTHGLHLDNKRGIYPYRDWVVRAMNQNVPFDDFIEWQLAGDLLEEPTQEQLLATGYVRLNPSTGEGGAISAEFQAKNNFDRVETFGTVFLGMSLTCARCHTHKYDPIPQTEYYQLLAFFNNTSEPALDGNSYTYGAHIRTPSDQHSWAEWQTLLTQRDELLDQVAQLISTDSESSVMTYAHERADWKASGWRLTKPFDFPVSKESEPNLQAEPAGDTAAEAEKTKGSVKEKTLTFEPTKSYPGRVEGRAARKLVPKAGQAVKLQFDMKVNAQQSFWFTSKGSPESHLAIISSAGEELEESLELWRGDGMETTAVIALEPGIHTLELTLVGPTEGIIAELREPWAAVAKAGSWAATAPESKILAIADPNGPLKMLDLAPKLTELSERLEAVEASFTTSLVARELSQPRETRLLHRGEYDAPRGEPLKADVLSVLGGLPEDAPRTRLGLSKWLTSPEQPLVSRVLINRVWQQVFGFGLVRTPEDFGLQGQQPTHPELLDWLSVEFQESGWDYKHMLRLMVNSRVFRQDSKFRDEIDDPENRFYARGPSYRLDAEVLRDIALWSSQLLDPRMGGEGVKPYQPAGMWKALAHPASNTKQYQQDSGAKLYRRSLYVYWKRTSPHPMMTLFDAPDRESSCVRRSRTNTPLQSLALFNETQRVEMSRKLAARLLSHSDDLESRVDYLFKLLACREPSDTELEICRNLVNAEYARFEKQPVDAKSLLEIGEAKFDDTSDPVELAAWSQMCSTVLASDLSLLLY